jgi:APA family basic amino acid/polyamine antiporter
MMVWVITDFMTIAAAQSYRELSRMFHNAGGQYIYLKEV